MEEGEGLGGLDLSNRKLVRMVIGKSVSTSTSKYLVVSEQSSSEVTGLPMETRLKFKWPNGS